MITFHGSQGKEEDFFGVVFPEKILSDLDFRRSPKKLVQGLCEAVFFTKSFAMQF
jgi:hypothetical protein